VGAVPRLVRDPITWLTYGQLAIYCYFLYGFSPAIALLRDEQHVSSGVASLHGTAVAVGALAAGSTFPLAARRIGRGRAMWASLAGFTVSVAGLLALRPIAATLTFTFLAASFGISLVSGVVASLGERHGRFGATAIAEANALACAAGALAPLAIGATVAAGWTWRPAIGLVIVLAIGCALLARARRIHLPAGEIPARTPAITGNAHDAAAPGLTVVDQAAPPGDNAGGQPRVAAGRGRLPVGYWIAWVLMAITGSVEFCLNTWSGDVLRHHAGLSPGAAATAASGIVGGMCLGRLVVGRAALRVPAPRLLFAALGVSLLGFAVFWIAPQAVLALAGLMVAGFGNGMHYPLGIAMALQASAGRPDQAAARASYGMAVSFGVAPFVLGALADHLGARPAMLLVPVLLALAAVLVPPLARRLPPAAPTPLPRRPDQLPAAA
jgi:MFS family permease